MLAGGEWPSRCILYVMDGPHRLAWRSTCTTFPGLGLIYCQMYTKHRHELRHARKAWPGSLVDPCLFSGSNPVRCEGQWPKTRPNYKLYSHPLIMYSIYNAARSVPSQHGQTQLPDSLHSATLFSLLSLYSYTICRIEKYWFVTDFFENWFEN
jgi:hypothetical protein